MRLLLVVAAWLVACSSALPRRARAPTPRADAYTRLPGESLPTAIDVTITPYLDEQERSFSFDGSSTIQVSVLTDTNTLTLHSSPSVTSLVVSGDAGDLPASYEQLDDGSSFLVITLDQQVSAGDSLTLQIDFTGDILDGLDGFYRSSYEQDGETRWLGVTQFEETGARLAMPCYDEPAIKPTWSFTFRPVQGLGVRFNTPALSSSNDADGRQTVVFQQTPPIGAYLLAWLISDFQAVENPTQSNTTVWTNRDTLDQAEYAAISGPRTVSIMEQLVDVPYNYGNITKMDHAAIPDFAAGAMENWGLVTYRQGYLLIIENYTSEATKELVLTVIQHEVSHQWFGNLVSPNWWSVLWLSEGFATFFESFATAQLEPTWRLDEVFVVATLLETAMPLDSDSSGTPITSDDADSNIYYKGGSLIRMMQHVVTSDLYYEGLHNYQLAHQLSNATDEDLFAAMDAVAPAANLPGGGSVTSVMLPWVRQAGYPVLTVTRDYDTGAVTISQQRFILDEAPDDRTWSIPLTYTTAAEADFTTTTPRAWLTDAQQTFQVGVAAADWLILNVQVVGFYRINYDPTNWALLATQLQSDPEVLPPVNRAQLLDDAVNLVDAGLLDVDTAFELASYLAVETDYVPWLGAENILLSLYFYAEDIDAFQTWALSLLEAVTAELGFTEAATDSHTTRIHRGVVAEIATFVGQEAWTTEAYRQFQVYMAAPDDPAAWVGPDLKSVVYCEGARQGGADAVAFLLEQYQTTTVISEMDDLLIGLTCAGTRYYNELLEKTAAGEKGGVRQHDLIKLLKYALNWNRNPTAAIDFISKQTGDSLKRLGVKKALTKILTKFLLQVRDEEIMEKLREAGDALESKSLSSRVESRARSIVERSAAIKRQAANWLRRRSPSRVA